MLDMLENRLPRARTATSALLSALLFLVVCSAGAQEAPPEITERLSALPVDRMVLPIGKDGQEIELVVSTPHTYDPSRKYPALVVLDADPLLGLLKTVGFLWGEEGKAAPVILVGVPFGADPGAIWKNRTHYLLPQRVEVIDYYDAKVPVNSGGGAGELADFLQSKVVPAVLDEYSIDPSRLGLAGFSMGGLYTAWHLVTHPGLFSDYLVVAPPLAEPFVGPDFERATDSLRKRGFAGPTKLYVAWAEDDLQQVLSGASAWANGWTATEDADFHFRSEMFEGHRHDSGAIPALINGYGFLYGN
jgi:predicted alpha/beta superfamily hydrolase